MAGRVRQKKKRKKKKGMEAEREREREGFLICFLGTMTKLRGMQQRGEREVIKSSGTRRGGKNRRQTGGEQAC